MNLSMHHQTFFIRISMHYQALFIPLIPSSHNEANQILIFNIFFHSYHYLSFLPLPAYARISQFRFAISQISCYLFPYTNSILLIRVIIDYHKLLEMSFSFTPAEKASSADKGLHFAINMSAFWSFENKKEKLSSLVERHNQQSIIDESQGIRVEGIHPGEENQQADIIKTESPNNKKEVIIIEGPGFYHKWQNREYGECKITAKKTKQNKTKTQIHNFDEIQQQVNSDLPAIRHGFSEEKQKNRESHNQAQKSFEQDIDQEEKKKRTKAKLLNKLYKGHIFPQQEHPFDPIILHNFLNKKRTKKSNSSLYRLYRKMILRYKDFQIESQAVKLAPITTRVSQQICLTKFLQEFQAVIQTRKFQKQVYNSKSDFCRNESESSIENVFHQSSTSAKEEDLKYSAHSDLRIHRVFHQQKNLKKEKYANKQKFQKPKCLQFDKSSTSKLIPSFIMIRGRQQQNSQKTLQNTMKNPTSLISCDFMGEKLNFQCDKKSSDK